MKAWLRRWVLLSSVVLATPLQAALAPSLRELEAAIKKFEDDPGYPVRLGGVPGSGAIRGAARDYLRELFADDSFLRDMQEWLATLKVDRDDPEALLAAWLERYGRTLAAGATHLDDAEIEFMLGSTLMRAPLVDQALCELLEGPGGEEAAARLPTASNAEVLRYFAILRRIYLAALANKVPRPMPTLDQLTSARMGLLARLAQADREAVLRRVTDPAGGSVAENCAAGRIFVLALDGQSSAEGRMLRRDLLVSLMRIAMDPATAPIGPLASATGTQGGGQFEPGPVALDYPVHAVRAGVEGTMVVRIWVDEAGRASRVRTIQREFNQTHVKLHDGSELGVDELFDPIVAVFYRAGRFMRQFKDGKPQGYVVEVPMSWKLEK